MTHHSIPIGAMLAASAVFAAERPVKMKDLPAAVQKTVREETKGAELKGLSRETENGKTFYEAETLVNGKSRDVLIDPAGAVVEVEQEIALDAVPAAALSAIRNFAGKNKIVRVESVTKGGEVAYEATIQQGLRRKEFMVGLDGRPRKD